MPNSKKKRGKFFSNAKELFLLIGKILNNSITDPKTLFKGTFILLAFIFVALMPSSLIMILRLEETIWPTLLFNLLIPLLEAVPIAFFVSFGFNISKGKFSIPSWKNIPSFFIKGIQLIIIYSIYRLPLFLILYFYVGINPFLTKITSMDQELLLNVLKEKYVIVLSVALPIYILTTYLLPIVALRFIEKKKFFYAFDFKTIFRKAFSLTYLLAWLVSISILLIAALVLLPTFAIIFVTLIGIILLFFLVPMALYILWLLIYGIYGFAYGKVK